MPFATRPSILETSEFVIRPQREQDNEPDYAAVIANREWLQRWSGSPWPEESFTAADNLEDLRMHIAEHRSGEALGYTIANPGATEVLGSLYLQPVGELLDTYDASDADRATSRGYTVRADIWTRIDRDASLLARVIAAANPWLCQTYGRVLWCARVDCPELEAAYTAAGLARLVELEHPESGRLHRLFGPLA